MAGKSRTKRTPREQATRYRQSGHTFLAAAEALDVLAGEDESYGSAIALLVVHAAISLADSITIAYGERKSASGNHAEVVSVLRAVLGNGLPDKPVKLLAGIIKSKDAVAYQGKYFGLEAAREILTKGLEFAAWAEDWYQERPT